MCWLSGESDSRPRGALALRHYARRLLVGAALLLALKPQLLGAQANTVATLELGQADLFHGAVNSAGAAALNFPAAAAVDSSGHLYVADVNNNRVLGWKAVGALADGAPADLVIGQPDFYAAGCNDGSAAGDLGGRGADSLCGPTSVAVDSQGNLYVADAGNNRVLVYAAPYAYSGTRPEPAAVVFGQGGSMTSDACSDGVGGDPAPSAAGLCFPVAVALDAKDNLYVADADNRRVLVYDTPLNPASGEPGAGDATADFVFGTCGRFSGSGCGPGPSAQTLAAPFGVAVDSAGDLFVADHADSRVVVYQGALANFAAPNTTANLVFGQPDFGASGCNDGTAAGDAGGVGPDSLCHPGALAVDSLGNLYVADSGDNRVLAYNTPLDAASGEPGAGDTVADLVIGQNGLFTTAQCNGAAASGDVNGLGADSLCGPAGVATGAGGILVVADTRNNRLLEFFEGAAGPDSTLASLELGQPDFRHATANRGGLAALNAPTAVAVDAQGHLYVADAGNSRVLAWTAVSALGSGAAAALVFGQPDGFSSGCNNGGSSGDINGLGPDSLCQPRAAAVDTAGNLYVADTGNNRLLVYYQPFGSLSGTPGVPGAAGDTVADLVLGTCGGAFTANLCSGTSAASLSAPKGVALGPSDDLYVADTGNNRVLYYPAPIASGESARAVLGQGASFSQSACNASGAASAGTLCGPTGAAFDPAGNLYVADTQNNRLLVYYASVLAGAVESGTAAAVNASAVFGQAASFSAGLCNGPAGGAPDAATLCLPEGIAFDASGNLYVTDSGNNRVLGVARPLADSAAPNYLATMVFGQGSFADLSVPAAAFTTHTCNGGSLPDDLFGVGGDSLCRPRAVAVGPAGELYAADFTNNRVLRYVAPTFVAPRLKAVPLPAGGLGRPRAPQPQPTAPLPGARPTPQAGAPLLGPAGMGADAPTASAAGPGVTSPATAGRQGPTVGQPHAQASPAAGPVVVKLGQERRPPKANPTYFATVPVGGSMLRWVALENSTAAALSGRIEQFAPGSAFGLVDAYGRFTLAPGERLWLAVQFRPAYPGSFSESLTITMGETGEHSISVLLRGVGE